MAIGKAAIAPRIPVPIISPRKAIGTRLANDHFGKMYLKASPQQSAPTILPGKASSVPVPIISLISDVTNAIPTAYHGPSSVPAITFTIC